MAEKMSYFTYKGLPLVRCGKQMYYGNMYDDYVVWIEILESKKIGNLEIGTKIRVRKMATDISAENRIVKKAEKENLYDALDIAYAWIK